ncbi:MAG: hypothetical protein PHX21_06315 [bacterium]|nr:hypothetical protein [bacterium]
MGINLFILLLQIGNYFWIPELSVRSELLSELSAGIISDTVTNVFLNPAYASKTTQNIFYLGRQGKPCEPPSFSNIRGIAITNLGLSCYMRIRIPFSAEKFDDLPEKRIGIAYAHKIGNKSLGIGYFHSYGVYGFADEVRSIEIKDNFSLGMILNNSISTVINFFQFQRRDTYSYQGPYNLDASNINIGVKFEGKINNYFSIIYAPSKDTISHHTVILFNRTGKALVTTSTTKFYIIGQLENYYAYNPLSPVYYQEGKVDDRTTFRLGLSGEKILGNFSIFGNFLEYIGHSTCTNFVFLSDEPPVSLGVSFRASPIEIWIKTSPDISNPSYWNIELSIH